MNEKRNTKKEKRKENKKYPYRQSSGKDKNNTFTDNCRDNPFIVATISLGIVVIFLLIVPFFNIQGAENEKVSLESLCTQIQGTPTWINASSGKIMAVGYLDFDSDLTLDIVNEELIPNNIAFFYHPQCFYCQEQIKSFGGSWQDYLDSGLAIDCSK